MRCIHTILIAILATASQAWSVDIAKEFDQVVQKMDSWNKANPSFHITVKSLINDEEAGKSNLFRIMSARQTTMAAEVIGVMGSDVNILMTYNPNERRAAISSNKLNYWSKIDEKMLLSSSAFQSGDPLAPFDIRALKDSIKAVANKEGSYDLLFFVPKASAITGGNKDNPEKPLSNPTDAMSIALTVDDNGFLRKAESVIGAVRSVSLFTLTSTDEKQISKFDKIIPNYVTMRQNELNIFMNDISTMITKRTKEK